MPSHNTMRPSGPYQQPALTPSGGHQDTYGWQAGGKHSNGMLSCFKLIIATVSSQESLLSRTCSASYSASLASSCSSSPNFG